MRLNFSQTAEGLPPLIILHGLFGSARNWQSIARQLSDRYTVYALDLRNHGSSPHDKVMDYPAMSADVIEFIDQHKLQNPIVLGHSLGGKVAMQLALSEPDEVLLGFSHVPLDSIKSRKEADSYLAEKINSVSLRQFLLQNLVNNASGGYQWRVNLASIEANMDTIMGFPDQQLYSTFNKASLFIKGANSSYLAPRYKALIDERFPEAEWQTIANTGHWPHIESPIDFMACLDKFLSA
jgi:esterase